MCIWYNASLIEFIFKITVVITKFKLRVSYLFGVVYNLTTCLFEVCRYAEIQKDFFTMFNDCTESVGD